MDEYEKAREEIAIQICDEYGGDNWTDLPEGERQDIYQLATQILSLVEIKSDDQSLPYLYERDYEGFKGASSKAQEAMLKVGFVKVIPHERT